MTHVLVLTCEHASNRIPERWEPLFRGKKKLLGTHRGYDLGALAVARGLARLTGAPLLAGTASRLLVELNRSPGSRGLFSEITRPLPAVEKAAILEAVYLPHRAAVERALVPPRGRGVVVVHVGVHSFTPVLNGVRRNADVGLLFDPGRAPESALCRAWRVALKQEDPGLRVRFNYPYRGTSDGLTTALRRTRDARSYLGIELEIGNAGLASPEGIAEAVKTLGASLARVLATAPKAR